MLHYYYYFIFYYFLFFYFYSINQKSRRCSPFDHRQESLLLTPLIISRIGSSRIGSGQEDSKVCRSEHYTSLLYLGSEIPGTYISGGVAFLRRARSPITVATGDPRERSFFDQRISMAIQWCNCLCTSVTFYADTT